MSRQTRIVFVEIWYLNAIVFRIERYVVVYGVPPCSRTTASFCCIRAQQRGIGGTAEPVYGPHIHPLRKMDAPGRKAFRVRDCKSLPSYLSTQNRMSGTLVISTATSTSDVLKTSIEINHRCVRFPPVGCDGTHPSLRYRSCKLA